MIQKVRDYQPNFPASANFAQGAHSGLNFTHTGGLVTGVGDVVETAAGTVAVPASGTWGIYMDINDGVLKAAATASLPATNSLLLYTGSTQGGSVVNVVDVRSWTAVSDSSGVPVGNWDDEVSDLSPLLWYAFDEASGSLDNKGSLGSAWDTGTGQDSPTYAQTGQLGSSEAITYTADGYHRLTPPGGNPFDAGGGSFLIMFKRDGNQSTGTLLNLERSTNSDAIFLEINEGNSHRPNVILQDAAQANLGFVTPTTGYTVPNDTWVMLTYTFDATNVAKMYVNGAEHATQYTGSDPKPDVGWWFTDFAGNFTSYHHGRKGVFFDGFIGDIDEVVFFDEPLTASQILVLSLAAGL